MTISPFIPRVLTEYQPIVVGLIGQAATGKTSVGHAICPPGMSLQTPVVVEWDHITFASPLYEMVSIKEGIEGPDAADRQLYELHRLLVEIFGGNPLSGAPSYSDLVSLVHRIYSTPVDKEGKPRNFLQTVGTWCRELYPTCFADYARTKILQKSRTCESPLYAGLISDVRYPNEAEMIKAMPNGFLVKFTASDEVREQRLIDRDGATMTFKQKQHSSEQVDTIPDELVDVVIDSDELNIRQQAMATRDAVFKTFSLNQINPEDYIEHFFSDIEAWDKHEFRTTDRQSVFVDWIDIVLDNERRKAEEKAAAEEIENDA